MCEQVNTDPHFSAEAQETFVVGERVFTPSRPIKHDDAEGVYLGQRDGVAVVDFDDTGIQHVAFDNLRNLYR